MDVGWVELKELKCYNKAACDMMKFGMMEPNPNYRMSMEIDKFYMKELRNKRHNNNYFVAQKEHPLSDTTLTIKILIE